MKIVQLLLSITAVIVAALWAWHARTWDSYCALAAAVAAVSAIEGVRRHRARTDGPTLSQNVRRGAVGIQAGRDVSVSGQIRNERD